MSGWPGWQIAAVSWAFAALLLVPASRPRPRRRARSRAPGTTLTAALNPRRSARPAAVLVAAALALASHPAVGLFAGAALWWLLPAVVARLETNEDVAVREALAGQLPMVSGLLSACLSAGSTPAQAMAITAEAMPQPAAAVLHRAARTLALGGTPAELAAVLAQTAEPGWRNLAAAIVRSASTGAPLADLLHEQADAALRSWAAQASVRARSVAVRSVLPLALCYLPAFLVLGVAPLVAGLLAGVQLP